MNFLKIKLDGREKIIVQRTVFASAAFILVFFSILAYSVMFKGANYPANIASPAVNESSDSDETLAAVGEPEFSYDLVKLTFGGTCTTATMLGSEAYGTFGSEYNERGETHFFGHISEFFSADDMTLVGLNAVLSDSDNLVQAEKEVREWYRAPSAYAGIFTFGGIEAVSLECERSKDYGAEGYADTKAALENAGLVWGDSGKAIYKEYSTGIGTAYYCSVLRESDSEGIISWIMNARQNYDFVALYFFDNEKGNVPSDAKKALFRSYIDAGADLVIGTNGDSLQPYEEYGNGIAVYSLGSLIDGASKYGEKYSALACVELRSNGGELTETVFDIVPVVNYNESHAWCPSIVSDSDISGKILSFMKGETDKIG